MVWLVDSNVRNCFCWRGIFAPSLPSLYRRLFSPTDFLSGLVSVKRRERKCEKIRETLLSLSLSPFLLRSTELESISSLHLSIISLLSPSWRWRSNSNGDASLQLCSRRCCLRWLKPTLIRSKVIFRFSQSSNEDRSPSFLLWLRKNV